MGPAAGSWSIEIAYAARLMTPRSVRTICATRFAPTAVSAMSAGRAPAWSKVFHILSVFDR
jgi:hypothetical protein